MLELVGDYLGVAPRRSHPMSFPGLPTLALSFSLPRAVARQMPAIMGACGAFFGRIMLIGVDVASDVGIDVTSYFGVDARTIARTCLFTSVALFLVHFLAGLFLAFLETKREGLFNLVAGAWSYVRFAFSWAVRIGAWLTLTSGTIAAIIFWTSAEGALAIRDL